MFITIVHQLGGQIRRGKRSRWRIWRRNFRIGAFAQTPAVRIENMSTVRVREEFKRYFLNEGQVSWQ